MSVGAGSTQEAAPSPATPPEPPKGTRARWRITAIAAGAVVVVCGIAAGAAALVWSPVHLRDDGVALAGLDIPPGASVSGARAIGPDGRVTLLDVRGSGLWPRAPLASGERVRVEVTVHRPAAVGWLVGSSAHLTLSLRTPSARVTRRWVSLADGAPLTVAFDQPVHGVTVTAAAGSPESRTLTQEPTSVTLARTGPAGTVSVAATARSWERAAPATLVSWFPAGRRPVAVVHPAGAETLAPRAPVRLTLSRPVSAVLGTTRPVLEPSVPGAWSTPDPHTLVFTPSGLGFPLGAAVHLSVPKKLDVVGTTAHQVRWTVPGGTEERLQQLLAQLGYLPLRFRPSHPVAATPDAQLAAAESAPSGRFTWRWSSTPAALRALWTPGKDGVMTRGAVMAFQRDQGLTTDGLAGGRVWQALLHAVLTHHTVAPGYTYVMVSRTVPQALALWHNGRIVVRSAVNTGVAAAPTDPGTYPVFEHIASATMSGTNPDGSHYSDPGVPWISYFNGGDALHGFPRGSYGVPQSVGCVELPIGAAAKVWPYTPVGTLVTVS